MKIQLKKFPNGAHIVYEGNEFVKRASIVRDHFCLVPVNVSEGVESYSLYLHRDTYVEPLVSTTQM